MAEELQFKVSSALKDIIGRDLITDDFIAVFELVKNSFDAYAKRVDVRFENLNSPNARIIIKDNGKGMSLNDLLNKWLFVAYSAKKEGTEDAEFDYRDSIYTHRPFAGAKGIGRFSCDRLGKKLYLETTKKQATPKTEVLITEWERFEEDIKTEFVDIKVSHETIPHSDYGLEHGTVLIISDLRSNWDRLKLIKLKSSLAKLINPSDTNRDFSIHLDVPEELGRDNHTIEDYDKVNGEVGNFIFEALGLRTTKITAVIDNDGKTIETQLTEGGTLIYRIKERNNYPQLNGIRYTLYYLNMSAKVTFTRRMGLPTRQFGHIFLYRNGFRIYPYGEPGEDPLKIDVRKAQGQRRFLGTRDLIGQIEINNNSDQLRETSSRGDGLIKTETYEQLSECFWTVLRRLEKYVVDVQQWGLNIEDDELDIKTRINNLIAKLSGSEDIIELDYDPNFLEIIDKSQIASAEKIVQNLNRIALETGNEELLKEAKRAADKLFEIQQVKEEAEQEAIRERLKTKKAEKDLIEKVSENLFLKSVKSQDFDEIVSFIHHIGISSSIIDNYLTGLHNELDEPDLDIEDAKRIIKLLIFENKKVLNISRFATKANFKLTTDAIELDIVNYLQEYIENIVQLSNNKQTRITFIDHIGHSLLKQFKPIEINILIDNFLSNSKKAGATQFMVELNTNVNNEIIIEIKDNGSGIPKENLDQLFNFGFTTLLGGSGIGLFHVKEIIDRMGGDIFVNSEVNKGTIFTITLR